jgi:hypothetical protein
MIHLQPPSVVTSSGSNCDATAYEVKVNRPSHRTRIALVGALLLNAVLLAACGGGSGTSSMPASTGSTASTSSTGTTGTTGTTGSTTVGSTTTATPTLSGNGTATVTAGTAYSFTPTVSPGGLTLTFSAQNKPAWATLDVATGKLSGTPAAADIGTFANITITATNGTTSASLASFTITVAPAAAQTGTASLSWTPPTQNTDGSALTSLAGYFIYYGNTPGSLSNRIQVTNAGLTAYTISGLASGTTYFGITAYVASGAESALSNIGSKTI